MKERIAYDPNPAAKQTPGWKAHVMPLRVFWLGLALSLIGSSSVRGQITTISQGSQLPSPQVVGSMPDPNDGPRETDPALEQQRIQALKIIRQAEMVSDTNKLLKLTVRLNSEIEQSHAKSLTHQQLRMLAKIEKLAKSVKQDMSSTIQVSP
jgi:hypothetical protein